MQIDPLGTSTHLFRRAARLLRRNLVPVSVTVLGVALFVGYHGARGQETMNAYQFSREAQQGKSIAPVPLNLMGKNPELVYIGSYLVNAKGGCVGCHTCPTFKGTDPFKVGGPPLGTPPNPGPINVSNYLAGGVPFPGQGVPFQGSVLTAGNLTPDSSGLPGGLTYDDFKNAMQNGSVSKKPGHVLMVMPWPFFRNLDENDFVAIYQYLSAIPHADPGSCKMNGDTGN